MLVRSPFVVTDTMGKYDVFVSVKGGGYTGQAGCPSRHCKGADQSRARNFAALKSAGSTRDPRMKERKKYGLKAARRRPQFSKR